jgi:prolyl oligopeptidase
MHGTNTETPTTPEPIAQVAPTDDPYLWLEEVEGTKALSWVEEQNKESLALFESDARYGDFLGAAETILNATDRIPYGIVRNGQVYNFWQDKKNVRGLWRRTTLASYRTDKVQWETVLDFDALAKAENENWVYKGVDCLAPEFNLCMVRLSRGGKDASVYREFDIATKTFVKGGFELPEAKSSVTWIDRDTLMVSTDWGDDTLTESGYPRIVKTWKRGTALKTAATLLAGEKKDIGVWPSVMHLPGETLQMVIRSLTFFTAEYFLRDEAGKLTKLPLQESAEVRGYYAGRILVSLREAWTHDGKTYPQAALLAFSAEDFAKSGKVETLETIYVPDNRTSIEGVRESKTGLYVTLLQNVKGLVLRFSVSDQGEWTSVPVDLPKAGSISISSANPYDETVFFNYEDHITPDRLFEYAPEANTLSVLKTLPDRFDSAGLAVDQFEVKSKDGESVPSFLSRNKDTVLDGETPTVLYGYGGFEISLTPWYSAISGKLWLERGGAYAIANIRGGGEFGPRWHKAALKKNRQRAYDDFIAVASDLIERKVTSSPHLGIMGGSNGGLLVGAAFTQRPDLFGAVVCQVPLLDMYRYTKLLAGASWAAEYGDPEDPEMWEAISKYSPYQNVFKDRTYPDPFFLTSTKDDRVHPAHARKMVARMKEQGHGVFYYENTEGGHAAAANQRQRAQRYALEYVYLSRQLGLN